ncbi:MAG: hypothetical protein FWG77_11945 [Treponema sp.]|nr:hypothetical protein [Treponema sp.]
MCLNSKKVKIPEKQTNEMSSPELWAYYFEYLTDRGKRGKINEIVEQEEGIAMASLVLMTISKDEEERARIMRDYKIEIDYQSDMAYNREQGETKKALDIAQNMLNLGFPPETVASATMLDLETVKTLLSPATT